MKNVSNHRSKPLRDSARDEPCIVCGTDGTTVWAHSNEVEHGKGMGIKAHDLLGLYLCATCHGAYDQRLDREQRRKFFREYYPATMVRVAEKIA
jgi:hypothetical protein